MALLEVKNLSIAFDAGGASTPVVDGVSFSLEKGQALGVVGESGCGKSMTALSIMGLLPQPSGSITGGQIVFEGQDLTQLSTKALCNLRGNDIAMIFQDPMTALNPVHRIGAQLAEVLALHAPEFDSHAKRRAECIALLKKVQLADPESRVDAYPHQLSGGQRQRVMIAMALACRPKLLIADEPTTALDVTVQAEIMSLIDALQSEYGMAMLFITHDLALVKQNCEHIAVMYAGQIIEQADAKTLFNSPRHPYTRGLLAALPSADRAPKSRIAVMEGQVPPLADVLHQCRFANRCAHAENRCRSGVPQLEATDETSGHRVACVRWRELT